MMLAFVASTLISSALGHGWMTKPISRASLGCTKSNNWYYCESHQATMHGSACDNLPCGQCDVEIPGGGGKKCNPGEYPGRGTPKEPYCNPNQMVNTSFLEAHGKVHARLTAGETIDVAWMVSAPHGGQYQYRLCLDGTDTEECFKRTPLLFADGRQWHRLDYPCTDCIRKQDQFGRFDGSVKPDKIVIPKDIQCERCTLGWRWDASGEPTIFTSCADVSISAAPISSPSPTPAPNLVEDYCVDELGQRCGGKMKCCKPNMTCNKVNRWVSQCEPSPSPSLPPTPYPTAPPSPTPSPVHHTGYRC